MSLLFQAFVAFRRIDNLLCLEERTKYYDTPTCDDIAVLFDGVNAEWKTQVCPRVT